MNAPTPKPRFKPTLNMTIPAVCVTKDRTDVAFRDKLLVIDEPQERGGTNLGMSPVEVATASLIGCTNVIANKVAKLHGAQLSDMTVEAEVIFDRRGAMLLEEVDVPWTSVILHINATTDALPEQIEAIKRDLPRFCPVSKLFKQSGTNVEERWTLNQLTT
ncbi:OsmC family protein [Roseobacter sp. YSTF-M11]|uniref:OsmC family protein n=1 Tax=Roseobacter insulae TaxID=2859783 RepID=A0A9X1JZW2_9RHOB|nr:OsmC family protein [Roseobacter insulae]MBW4709816.1 OsmC family protein [Roseobacter insulae]